MSNMDPEKDCSKGLMKSGNRVLDKCDDTDNLILSREIKKLKIYAVALFVLLVVVFLIIAVSFSVLYANMKYDLVHHDHPPKLGDQMAKILEKEELCLLCDEVRLGPSTEEDAMLDVFVRKRPSSSSDAKEQCCVETPTQLLQILQLFVERKNREEMARGNIKVKTSTYVESGKQKPAAHLMGSLRKLEQPTVPGRQFSISHWTSMEDLAFTNMVQYRQGRIVIMEEGQYYIYSQLSFLEVFDTPNAVETGSQSLSHYIYRYNIIYPHGGEELMIQNSLTKCWSPNKDFIEYSSYLGALFHLRQGDELFVKVSNLTLIVPEPKLNYFGLFKIH